jgi:hypothetical protein
MALQFEAFSPVLAVVELDCSTSNFLNSDGIDATFVKEATRFANEDCWGTLSCNIHLISYISLMF